MTTQRLSLLLLLPLLLASPAWAVTRFVSNSGLDTNSCSASQNINTPKKNLRGLSGALRCMGSGDTLYIREGTYVEHIVSVAGGDPNITFEMPSGGGSWATATTIAGYPGDARPVLRAPHDGHQATLRLHSSLNHSWILFDRLDLDGDNWGKVYFSGTGLTGIQHVRLSNSIVHNSPNTCIGGGGTDVQFLNNEVHHCPTSVTGSGYGWYVPCTGCLWENNYLHDVGGYGIHEYETSIPSGLDNNIIRNNRFVNIGASGGSNYAIIMAHGHNNQAYNNLIYNSGFGIQFGWDSTAMKVYNNTIVNNTGAGIGMLEFHPGDGFIRNNIVYNPRSRG